MALTLISVPIGNLGDITLRALESLKGADLFIGEERKPMFRLIKELGLPTPKNYALLNEHSTAQDIQELSRQCQKMKTVLITDCGTPGFSDPGAELVAACRQQNIPVTSNPGASSLTTFLSLCGVRLPKFHFVGFLPRSTEDRDIELRKLSKQKEALILMDTPYRLQKILKECELHFGHRQMVLGLDLTKENEKFFSGAVNSVVKQCQDNKREFMLLIH
jgi:16S rRNA (cytidine1402-2'-O)-methyltransferase